MFPEWDVKIFCFCLSLPVKHRVDIFKITNKAPKNMFKCATFITNKNRHSKDILMLAKHTHISLPTVSPLSPSIRARLENYPWSNFEKNLCEIFFSSCLLHSCHVGALVSRGHLHMAHNHLVLSVWATVTLHQDINMAVRFTAYFIKLLPE